MSSATYDGFAIPSGQSLGLRLSRQLLFNSLLVWYWLLLYFQSHNATVERFSVLYFALILPVAAFVVLNLHHAISWRYERLMSPLVLYIVLTAVISVVRGDLATAYNTALFSLPIILIFRQRLQLSLEMLNGLFLLSIAGAIITYWAGLSEFGFLPGQSEMGADRGLEWRVSLFPVVPESAFFALLVLFANWIHGRGRGRVWLCIGAGYFVALSGNRTSMIAAIMMATVVLFSRWVTFRNRRFYKTLFIVLAVAFVLVVSMDAVLLAFAWDNPYLASYLFRTDQQAISAEELAKTVYRSWLWQQHLQIYAESPLIGVGTFFLPDLLTETLIERYIDTGSESFLTGLLARIGLLILPLAVFFVRLCRRAMEHEDRLAFCLCLALFIFSLGYGSFLVPYNFMFLAAFALMNGIDRRSPIGAAV